MQAWQNNFKDSNLLRLAFTHRSYLNEHPEEESLGHNERLEFLGDAVLELIVTEFLFNKYPDADEGAMTTYRAALVNADTLGAVAAEVGMNDHLRLSKGEQKDKGRARMVILANTFEAVVGAMFLDQGYEAVKNFLAECLFPKTEEIVQKNLWQDPKSFFQEKAQGEHNATPVYKLVSEEGPDHDKVFTVALYINDELVSQGSGSSKQRAEQEAARLGLEKKGWK
jgi:ribonuclease-3